MVTERDAQRKVRQDFNLRFHLEEDKKYSTLPGRPVPAVCLATQKPFICWGGMNEPACSFIGKHVGRDDAAAPVFPLVSIETSRAKQKLSIV